MSLKTLLIFVNLSVPCLRRAISVEEEYEAAGGEVLLDNDDNDGWLATHGMPKGNAVLHNLLAGSIQYHSIKLR